VLIQVSTQTGSGNADLNSDYNISGVTDVTATVDAAVGYSQNAKFYKLTILAAATTATATISVIDDAFVEINETVSFQVARSPGNIWNSTDAGEPETNYRVGSGTTLTIISDDVASNPQPVITRSGSGTTKDPLTITTTFSEAVVNVSAGDLVADAGSLSAFQAISATIYTWTWTPPAGTGSATLSMGAAAANALDDNAASLAATGLVVTYDTQAPAVSAPALSNSSNSGSLADTITKVTMPIITGAAESGATVRLYNAAVGGTLLGSTTSTGTWSITTSALSGNVSIYAEAQDAVGNVSARTGPLALTIDTTPPALTVNTVPTSPTNLPATDWSGTVESGATITAEITGSVTTTANAQVVDTNWTLNLPLADGTYSVRFHADDVAGNRTTTTTPTTLLVDTFGPIVVLNGPTAAVRTTASLTAAYSDAGSGVNSISLTSGQVTVIASGTAAVGSLGVSGSDAVARTIALNAITGDGTISVTVQANTALDGASNSSSVSNTLVITVDNTAPVVAITTGTTITADVTPTITGTSDDNGATIELRNGTTVLGTGPVVAGHWTITPTAALTAGAYNLTARGTDVAGNAGTDSAAVSVTINLGGPSVVISGATISGTTATFTATFSQAVTGLTAGDFVVGGTAGGVKNVSIVADATNRVFTVTVTGLAAPNGTVTLHVPADVAVATAGGDPTQESNTVTVAFTVPVDGGPSPTAGGGGGGGCGAGGLAGLLLGALMLVGLRRCRR